MWEIIVTLYKGTSTTANTGPPAASEGQYYMLADSSEINNSNNKQAVLTASLNIGR